MSQWTGKTIGNVEVGELIARGGMAEVYYGEHKTLNRKVAVKIMRDFVDGDPETYTRFDREARVIANLNHSNIIKLFDYDLVNGQPCLVMELVPGVSLGGYLRNVQKHGEKLPFHMIAQILTALAEAIDYAHNQNIVHRDIKPANILLRSNSGQVDINKPLPADVEPVLTDFGLVRLIDSNTQTSTGTVSGTPAYMSPEQARGDKVDGKSDVYSLGVVLYEMLAGNVPFEAESSFGVLMKHMNEPPSPIPNISSDLQTVINRALAKNPANRYHSAKELADEFIAVFNGQTISMNTTIATKIEKTINQKTRPLNTLLAGVGVVALVALAFFALQTLFTPPADENKPIGKVTYLDFNFELDKVNINFTDLPALDAGTHYEVWYLAEGGETRRNIGTLNIEDEDLGNLVYISPNQENIFGLFDQVEITVEADNDPQPDESSGNVVASSVFPPFALIHVRHVLVSFPGAPEDVALIQGLWLSADEINNTALALQEALTNKDEETFRTLNETLITQLIGNNSNQTDTSADANLPQYPDVETNPESIFGLMANADDGETGYIPNVISHIEFASDASDATENIKIHGEHVLICINNMQGWADQLLDMAIELQTMPFGVEMEAQINKMRELSKQILSGVDTNGNEIIEPIISEGGADTAYEHAYYMADMPFLIGANRIPAPAPTESP